MSSDKSNELSIRVNALLVGATITQRKWVMARLVVNSDAAAAHRAGVNKATVCRWPNKAELDAAVAALLEDPLEEARTIMADAIPKAARVKVAGLDSRTESIRQNAATDILDRGMGRPTERHEVSGPDKGPIPVEHSFDDDQLANVLGVLASSAALPSGAAQSGDAKTK